MPEQVAGSVVRPYLVLGNRDDLGTQVILPDDRRRPGARLVAADAPVLLPGRRVERRDVRLLGVVVHHDQLVVEQCRRRAGPPTPLVGPVGDVAGPDEVAVEVVGMKALVAEQGVHPLAVGYRRRRGERVLRMDARPDRSLVRGLLPEHLAAVEVKTEHGPAVDARLHAFRNADAAVRQVQAGLRTFVGVIGDHRREEHLAVPDDRARPPETRNRGLPGHVLGGAPRLRQLRVVGHYRRPIRSSELRPVVGLGRGGRMQPGQHRQQRNRQKRQPGPFRHNIPLGSANVTCGNRRVHHAPAGVSTGVC